MAYVGTPIDTQNQFQALQGKRFNGDGSTTAFTLDIAPTSVFDIEVFVENVRQDPNSAYTLSGTTLTFSAAPSSGTNNIYVVHQAKAVGTIEVPDSYRTTSQTISGARNFTSNVGFGESSPSSKVHIKNGDCGNTPHAEADDLFIEDDDHAGLTIGSPNDKQGSIYFADDGSQYAGQIQYNHSTNAMLFATSATARMTIDGNGHVTMPSQSGFQAQNSSEQSNLAINSFVTLTFAQEHSDTNADYNNSNSTFTAPVTGKYLVTASLQFNNLDHDATYWQTQIKTSNREYTKLDSGNQYDADPTNFGYYQTMVVDMDANDTCIIRWYQGGGTAQADMRTESFFAMQLLA